MNVKNGIASSVELRHDAEHALGQRLQQRRLERAVRDADQRRTASPLAASENATG